MPTVTLGQVFGRLTVVSRAPNDKTRNSQWNCVCECGTQKIVRSKCLKLGKVKSCGCLQREVIIVANKLRIKHGLATGPLPRVYVIWSGILQRCYNKNNQSYKDYGARGITVCDSWHIFTNFLADMGEPPKGYSIERKDNNGNYCPQNCIWASAKTQNRNRRSNRILTYKGKTCTLIEHCEDQQIPYALVNNRLNKLGWPIEKALRKT